MSQSNTETSTHSNHSTNSKRSTPKSTSSQKPNLKARNMPDNNNAAKFKLDSLDFSQQLIDKDGKVIGLVTIKIGERNYIEFEDQNGETQVAMLDPASIDLLQTYMGNALHDRTRLKPSRVLGALFIGLGAVMFGFGPYKLFKNLFLAYAYFSAGSSVVANILVNLVNGYGTVEAFEYTPDGELRAVGATRASLPSKIWMGTKAVSCGIPYIGLLGENPNIETSEGALNVFGVGAGAISIMAQGVKSLKDAQGYVPLLNFAKILAPEEAFKVQMVRNNFLQVIKHAKGNILKTTIEHLHSSLTPGIGISAFEKIFQEHYLEDNLKNFAFQACKSLDSQSFENVIDLELFQRKTKTFYGWAYEKLSGDPRVHTGAQTELKNNLKKVIISVLSKDKSSINVDVKTSDYSAKLNPVFESDLYDQITKLLKENKNAKQRIETVAKWADVSSEDKRRIIALLQIRDRFLAYKSEVVRIQTETHIVKLMNFGFEQDYKGQVNPETWGLAGWLGAGASLVGFFGNALWAYIIAYTFNERCEETFGYNPNIPGWFLQSIGFFLTIANVSANYKINTDYGSSVFKNIAHIMGLFFGAELSDAEKAEAKKSVYANFKVRWSKVEAYLKEHPAFISNYELALYGSIILGLICLNTPYTGYVLNDDAFALLGFDEMSALSLKHSLGLIPGIGGLFSGFVIKVFSGVYGALGNMAFNAASDIKVLLAGVMTLAPHFYRWRHGNVPADHLEKVKFFNEAEELIAMLEQLPPERLLQAIADLSLKQESLGANHFNDLFRGYSEVDDIIPVADKIERAIVKEEVRLAEKAAVAAAKKEKGCCPGFASIMGLQRSKVHGTANAGETGERASLVRNAHDANGQQHYDNTQKFETQSQGSKRSNRSNMSVTNKGQDPDQVVEDNNVEYGTDGFGA